MDAPKPNLIKPNRALKREWQWCYECHSWEVHQDGVCPFCAMIAQAGGPAELAEIKRVWPSHFAHRGQIRSA